MYQSKKITDGALLTVAYTVLMVLAIFIPTFILVAIFLLPIPFIIYASDYDWKPSLVMFGAVIIISSLFATIITLPLTILVGLGGIMIGTALHRNLNAYEIWARGSIGFVIGLLLLFLFSQLVLQINWATEIDQLMKESMQMSQDIMKQFNMKEQSEEGLKLLQDSLAQVKDLLPAGIALLAIFLAFITQWLSYKVINRLKGKKLYFPTFRKLNLPTTIVWIYFLAFIVSLLDTDPNSIIYIAVHNVLVLSGMFIVIQGFSFIFFYAHHKKRTKLLPIISVILTLLFPLLLLYLVRVLGIIDMGFRLKDRISKAEK